MAARRIVQRELIPQPPHKDPDDNQEQGNQGCACNATACGITIHCISLKIINFPPPKANRAPISQPVPELNFEINSSLVKGK
jgi:hypothetical protein